MGKKLQRQGKRWRERKGERVRDYLSLHGEKGDYNERENEG
jgi:hypothetical protein